MTNSSRLPSTIPIATMAPNAALSSLLAFCGGCGCSDAIATGSSTSRGATIGTTFGNTGLTPKGSTVEFACELTELVIVVIYL
jgi:hypothetical protein